jgi:riboflavin synthase
MFTGIVEEIGKVSALNRSGASWRAEIRARAVLAGLAVGDSISLSGACQTVVALGADSFSVEITPETRRVSTLGGLEINRELNLETALTLSRPLGGHLVQGHVDAVGRVHGITRQGTGAVLEVGFPAGYRKYLAFKGSVCVDGISLTIADCGPAGFTVSVIPHTLQSTTLRLRRPGDAVNLEFDIIAKYVESLSLYGKTGEPKKGKGLSLDFLIARGF